MKIQDDQQLQEILTIGSKIKVFYGEDNPTWMFDRKSPTSSNFLKHLQTYT